MLLLNRPSDSRAQRLDSCGVLRILPKATEAIDGML